MNGWSDVSNAQKYDQYARKFPTYWDTSRDLVRFAEIKSGMSVVDLACGTGVTAQAISEVLNGDGYLHCVDASPAMLDLARQNLKDQNVAFHVSQAETLQNVTDTPVDRIICNAAFWQMNADDTLVAIRSVLKKTGIFAYNLPRAFFSSSSIDSGTGQSSGFAEQMRQIAKDDFGIEISKRTASGREYTPPTLDDIHQVLKRNGFTLITHKIITYTQTVEGAKEFCAIPVMTERILPGVDYKTRLAILEEVQSRVEPETRFSMPWLFVGAKIT